ncbi:MAG: type transport system ATP-binding protein [Solirubrobacteraceae bacterium]|jgi:ABC-2 type transport system ATP-binding protein|nr:type transport system ATP-binding protein [Solirubrobacteraceae bacterium]
MPIVGAADPAVQARGLVKRYGRITAVDDVDLTVMPGDVYGYLGPNGAGKTTTLRMMLGLIRPDAGSVKLFGRDPLVDGVGALDGVAGFVEAPRFYPYLTGAKNLELVAALDGGDAAGRIDEALDIVELADRARDKVGGYSHGMRQRLGLAGALLRDPRLLILDEPATGLDPGGMRDMRILIRRLADQGMTVLLSSHLMAEVEELCDRVVIISTGRVRYEGALDELIATTAGRYELRTTDDGRAAEIVAAQRGIDDMALDARGLTFAAGERAVTTLSIALGEAGVGIAALVPRTATLEELFFRMTEEAGPAGSADAPAETPEEVVL